MMKSTLLQLFSFNKFSVIDTPLKAKPVTWLSLTLDTNILVLASTYTVLDEFTIKKDYFFPYSLIIFVTSTTKLKVPSNLYINNM